MVGRPIADVSSNPLRISARYVRLMGSPGRRRRHTPGGLALEPAAQATLHKSHMYGAAGRREARERCL